MISRPLAELMARTTARQRIGVVIELSSTHPEGVEGAARDVEALLQKSRAQSASQAVPAATLSRR